MSSSSTRAAVSPSSAHARSARKGPKRSSCTRSALNIAIILHDIVVALNELNNPYLGILGVIVFVLGLILAGEERAKIQIDALRRSTHEAEARAEARTSFLSHMSHQVRTPLTEIRGLWFCFKTAPKAHLRSS